MIPFARITASGAVCAIGLSVEQIWAAARAGISRHASSPMHDEAFLPITMALLPDDVLPPLPPALESVPFSHGQQRCLRLALKPLCDAFAAAPQAAPVPLFVGLPEPRAQAKAVAEKAWLDHLIGLSGCGIDPALSQVYPTGRSAGFAALSAALAYLAQGRGRTAVVGGVDSFLDPVRLAELVAEERVLGERRMDGFVPGEGAAFVVLTNAPALNGADSTIVQALGMANDPGHRYSPAPSKGEGLADAIEMMRTQLGAPRAAAEVIFAGLNGEGDGAKEWGVAQLRHRDVINPEAMLEHPADRFGDLGAAVGAMLLALADASLRSAHRQGPALVWASSDREPRGCAWLDLESAASAARP